MRSDLTAPSILFLINFLVMLINTKVCTEKYDDEVNDEPGKKDTHVFADLFIGAEYNLKKGEVSI